MRRTDSAPSIRLVLLAAVGSIAASVAPGAQAADGRLEIHQSCVATGCFPGDAPGFPVELTAGSYVLTSQITVSSANTRAIQGEADVSLDLNGFSVVGVTSCTGAPAVCTGTGTGDGIVLGVRGNVRNGTVRKMGRDGISGLEALVVENVTVAENGRDGITASGPAQLIRHNRALRNGDDGVSLYAGGSDGGVVEGNTLHGNTDYGVDVIGAVVIHNTATYNGDEGIYMANGPGYGGNKLIGNNGGNANPQIGGSGIELAPNVCVYSSCP